MTDGAYLPAGASWRGSIFEKKRRCTHEKHGQVADDVMHSVYCLLKEMLIISDAHIWGLGRGATFLQTPPGCLEQVPVLPRRELICSPALS